MEKEIIEKPKTLIRAQTFVVLNWKDSFPQEKCAKFNLQIENPLKEWKTVYWGSKNQVKVDGLAFSTCHNFRIKPINSLSWLYFNSATKMRPFQIMHLSRAIQLELTTTIREIVLGRHELLKMETKDFKTPLFEAVERGLVPVVQILLSLGADPNVPLTFGGRTPLMTSIYKNHLNLAQILLDKGARIDSVDHNGLTILHYAVDSNCLENVQFCLQIGSLINQQDRQGWTSLLRAAILEIDPKIIDFLIKQGADASLKDRNGFDFHKIRQIKLAGL